MAANPTLAFAVHEHAPPALEVRVNFGMFAGREATPAEIDDLEAMARRMCEVGTPGPGQDLDQLVPLNHEFHARLVAMAAAPALATALAGAVRAPIVLRNFHTYDAGSLRRSLAHHLEIVAAMRAADPDWALAVMTAHIRNARAVMVRAARASVGNTNGHRARELQEDSR